MNRNTLQQFFFAFGGVVVVDQLVKWWATKEGLVILNSGISFGWGEWIASWFFSVLSVVVLVGLFFIFKEFWLRSIAVYGLLCGAAISNVIDRVLLGGVQDYLPIPILRLQNNIADWIIFGCMIWLGMNVLFSRSRK